MKTKMKMNTRTKIKTKHREVLLALLVGLAPSHSKFTPLPCNHMLDTKPCVPFSSLDYNLSETVEIGCGTCVTMDGTCGEISFPGGLDVVGKLVFPTDRQAIRIVTPFVFVQGALIVEPLAAPHSPQPDRRLEFHFVGVEDVVFRPHPKQAGDACGEGCRVSKKPFVVAGGTVDFQGLDTACHTWSRLRSIADAGPPSLSGTAAAAPPPLPRPGCSDTLVDESFQAMPSDWDGMVHLPIDCITPNAPYLLKFHFRYRHTSFDATEFVAPYAKMVQYHAGGGSSWLSVPRVYVRGQMSNVPVDEWHDMQMVVEFNDSMADSTRTSDLTIYIAPMSDVDTIDIGNFVLELAPAAAFDRNCNSLLVNGQANLGDHTYPFYSTGGVLNVVAGETGPTGTPYFRSSLRSSTWSSTFSQEIPPTCLRKAAIYEFSAHVRVHSPVARRVSFALWVDAAEKIIAICPPSSGEWILCTSKIRLEGDAEGASSSMLYTRVLDDESSPMDVADASMVYAGGRAIALTLDDASGVSECWGPGAEVLVTSHTIRHEDSQLAIIHSVDQNGVITLTEPIHKPITMEDDSMTAVEVLLLSRNIVFSSAEDDPDSPLDGGHFIVMHTPAPVVQHIVGVETRGNGQQGKLGKYPLHFHMCGSVAGSTLSKNSIRNTKQRGIVVHGTNDLYLHENVLYDTRGHAVMLEDGAEQGNTFEKNVGAVGHGVDIRISNAESDSAPATFWITNPHNTWIGNVAAGSQHSGFWFEVKPRVRGSSFNMHPDMVPNKLDLLNFTDNVSHSNAQGLQTYPQAGYHPERLAIFRNHKSYRNRGSGIFFHAGGRLSIDGGYISDNKIGIDIDMDHSDVVSNSEIVGISDSYREVVDAMGHSASRYPPTSFCSKDGDGSSPLVGVRLDSFHDGTLFGATGSKLKGVNFSGFGTGSCAGSSALHVDSEDIRYFDPRNSLENISVLDDSKPVNLCGGEMQVAIHDIDGSLIGESGFIVSDSDAIRAHQSCFSIPDTCAAFCPGVCLRTMTVMVPSYYERGELTLRVTGTSADGQPIEPIFVQDFQTKPMLEPKKDSSQGRLFVTLPSGGNYHGQFSLNDGQVTWPLYADLKYEDEVDNCGPDFSSFSIDELIPTQCDSLVSNGDFDASGNTDAWWYTGHYGMQLNNEGANGSSHSLLAPNPNDGGGRHVGLGQFLDTRCIEEGKVYTFSAMVKLVDSTGELYQCNLNGYSGDDASCPKANLRFTNRISQFRDHKWEIAARIQSNDLEWNLLSGSYVADAIDASAHSAYLYITGVPAGISISIDEVSFLRTDKTSSPPNYPTYSPSTKPSNSFSFMPETLAQSPFESSNTESITFGDETIRLATDSGIDSTVLSAAAHTGDIRFTVEMNHRAMSGSGYQPQLVLFFASDITSIDDVTTNDNGFGPFFEPSVVAWFKEKIYFNPDNPGSLNYTWFNAKLLGADNGFVSKGVAKNIRMNSGFLRLERSGGSVGSSYSFDGQSWVALGPPILLPEPYRTAPLKLGYRVKREWKSAYDITTHPRIVSNGSVTPENPSVPQSYFDNSNTESIGTSCSSSECMLMLDSYNSAMLSTETFFGDLSFIVKVVNREIFGSGYQSGLALFFTKADATINSVPIDRGEDGAFNNYVLAVVSDKIYPTIEHTWTNVKSQTDTGVISQSGGDGYKNMEGYLKLVRTGNIVSAFMSPNGNGWKAIGSPTALPSNYEGAPIKLGVRTFRNWCSSYSVSVMTTVEQS